MCVAATGKIISVDEKARRAVADFGGNEIAIDISFVKPKPDDYVLVHAGSAIEILKPETAAEIEAIMREIRELS